jgi:hypothetical protein
VTRASTTGRIHAHSRLARQAGMLVAAVSVAVAASVLSTRATTALAANPSPPFTQCPAVAIDTSCAILIVIQPDGSLTILGDPSQKPFDGSEDTLLGVQNNSGIVVPSIAIGSSTLAVFAFEAPAGEDGLCHFAFTGNGYCKAVPKPPTGYEGPDSRFSGISANKRDGTVNFTDAGGGLAAGASTYFSLENAITASKLGAGATTSLVFAGTSAHASDFADSATLAATLTSGGVPVANAPITFTLAPGARSVQCTGTTNSVGVATCSITPTQPAGSYQLVASYAGSSVPFLSPVNTGAPFAVTLEQDSLTYAGPLTASRGSPLVLSAAMTTDDPSANTVLSGRTVRLTLGSGATAQECNGYTDATGVASCIVIVSAEQPSGDLLASAVFVNDPFYAPATAAATVSLPASATITTPEVGGGLPALPAGLLLVVGGGVLVAGRRRRSL